MDPAREHAMREAFTEVFRLHQAMSATGNAPETDAEIERLATQADAISQPWETGPDASEWDWLNGIADDWRVAPEAMRRQMDTVHHDLRAGLTPFTPLQARSMHQAGTLIDSLYRQQTRWRAEHLADMAEYGRIDAQLESPGITTPDRHTLIQARTQITGARSADADGWSAERRVWERQYRIDPANREEERETYGSAYAAETHRLTVQHQTDTPAPAPDPGRDGARIGQLLNAAAPQEPAPAHPQPDPPDPAVAATALGEHEPDHGAVHELD